MLLQQHQDHLHASRVSLADHLAAAIPVEQNQVPFMTTAAHAALCNSAELTTRLAEEAQAADQQHSYSSAVPGWKQALAALQQAAKQSSNIAQGAGSGSAQDTVHAGGGQEGSSAVEVIGQQWQEQVETVVKSLLLWAQNIRGLDAEPLPDSGGFCLCFDTLRFSWYSLCLGLERPGR